MIKCDGILFDLDGTLWNATEAIRGAWEIVLRDAPDVERVPALKEIEGVMGMAEEPLMATLFPTLSKKRREELFAECTRVENDYLRVHGGKLYPGIEEMLRTLSQKLPLAVVSNCNLGYIPSFLEAHKLESCFRDWECAGRTGLEKWENIRLVAQRNGLKSPVYVGDTVIDQESAEKAGVPFIHAAYGFGKVPGAVSIKAPLELPELLGLAGGSV